MAAPAAPTQLGAAAHATLDGTNLVINVKKVINKKVVKRKRPGRPGAGHRPHRPARYRKWHRRPYYGRLIAGIAIGSLITAAVAGAAPTPPSPDLCWYWANSSKTKGYWDYCN